MIYGPSVELEQIGTIPLNKLSSAFRLMVKLNKISQVIKGDQREIKKIYISHNH